MFEDARTGKELEKLDFATLKSLPLKIEDIAEQDPWESRRAWGDVISALKKGDMKAAANAKSIVEQGQRKMRQEEAASGAKWEARFFKAVDHDEVYDRLSKRDPSSFTVDRQGGIWKVDKEAIQTAQKPYHGDLTPTNQRISASGKSKYNEPSGNHSRSQSEQAAAVPIVRVDTPQIDESRAPGEEAPEAPTHQKPIDPPSQLQADLPLRPQAEPPNIRAPEPSQKGPTDAEVEEFLRNKFSASSR